MKLLKIKEKLEKKQIKKRIIRKEFQNKSIGTMNLVKSLENY